MKRLKRLSVVLVLPAFLLVQSLSKCAPALAEPQSNNQQQDTQELLLKLSHYEKQLLKNGAPAAREKSKAENLAESQQEALVNEILRLRRQVRVLESQKQQTTAPDFEREQQVRDLKQELNNERQRVLGLEKQLEQLREARKMDSAQRQRMSENGAELSNERVVRQKLEKDLKDLQARYEQIKSDAAKSSVYREKYVSTTRNAQQMELELQAKRGIEADNKFLRTELERVKGEKVQLDAETQKAQRIAAEAEKQKKDAAAQLAAKEEEILTWKRQLSMTIEEVKSCQADSARKDQAVTAAGSLEGQLGGLREQLAQAEREKSVCSTELEATKQAMAKMGELRKDLVATKTELL
ncbi:MAG TPA: hypothetical protein PLP17_02340, partial [Oligoflexia bacterium]|nr:hypothetical protein [Oligoflexia bacterium]